MANISKSEATQSAVISAFTDLAGKIAAFDERMRAEMVTLFGNWKGDAADEHNDTWTTCLTDVTNSTEELDKSIKVLDKNRENLVTDNATIKSMAV